MTTTDRGPNDAAPTDEAGRVEEATEPMSQREDAAPTVPATATIELMRCSHCSTRVRRDELEIHLAHAHNVGPVTEKKKKGGRDRDRGSR